MNGKARNILELIGHTPIVRLTRLNPNPKVEVYVELEYFNPGGSVKDRPALAMVEAAEASGELTPDKIIIEATSGNTGIGLAPGAGGKGYRPPLALPENPAAHQGTSREIWEQTAGKVTTVIVTMGTTGTLMGVYRGLKEFNPAIQVVGVEPYLGHALQGLKNMKESYKPGIFDKTQADEIVHVEEEEAFR